MNCLGLLHQQVAEPRLGPSCGTSEGPPPYHFLQAAAKQSVKLLVAYSWPGHGTDTQGYSWAKREGTVPGAWLLEPRATHVERSHRGEMGQPLFIQNPKEFGLEPAEAPSLSNVVCPAL